MTFLSLLYTPFPLPEGKAGGQDFVGIEYAHADIHCYRSE